jgi:hypothetical protein
MTAWPVRILAPISALNLFEESEAGGALRKISFRVMRKARRRCAARTNSPSCLPDED